jgi:hypothetical protein
MHGSTRTESLRIEDRVTMAVPVHLQGGARGTTRDISASGIYFETDLEPIRESPLDFTVEFQNGGVGGLSLRCRGQVLRVERLGNGIGVAAKILESKLQAGRARPEPMRIEISDGFADSF